MTRVWNTGLWQVLGSFNIEEGLVQAIQALYETSSSAVLLNSQLEEFFKTTVGVHQGCLLFPMTAYLAEILFQYFLQEVTVSSPGIGKDVHSLN